LSRFGKIVVGIGLSLLVILVAGGLFLRHLVTKSFPVTRGSLSLSGLHATVDVYRDDYGVPHLHASDEHDLMMAAGYVQAQDRLWQMDVIRRAGEGRLSEIFGKPTLQMDMLFRTINLPGIADSIRHHLRPESEQILQAYAEGVNAFIDQNRGKFPVEFDILNYAPERWTVEHSILATRLIAWELNLAWWTDLTYGEIAAKVSPQKLKEILPAYPDSIPPTVPAVMSGKHASELHALLEIGRTYRSFFGLGSLESGSNAWVVDSSKSINGKPMLANDPHLAMPAPSRWYEAHLSAPDWNVVGVMVPGTPLIVIGHNDRIAWGMTNAMIDDADFYIEQTDSMHSNMVRFGKEWRPIVSREEKIYVGKSDSVMITVRSTGHGPIINSVHPSFQHSDTSGVSSAPIAIRWTGLEVSDEISAFTLIDKAESVQEFEQGVRALAVPAQSVVYADVDGNIAYWTAGKIPIRQQANAMLPLPGWTGDAEWKGYIPFEQLPHTKNPSEGFIACANQRIADKSYPYYLSTLWEPPSRITRIRELLRSAERFSPADFEQFQQDISSPFARDAVQYLLAAYNDTSVTKSAEISDALNYLHNWDFRFTQTDIATTIFNVFFVKLLHNIYEDEMGSDVFNDFVFFGAIPYRVTGQLLAADSSSWFDNIQTPQVETKNEILRKSLEDAVAELRTTSGEQMKTWQWGNLHTVTFSHPFGLQKPFDRVFNIGPFPIAGGGTTVLKTEYKMSLPFATSVGPSMRQIVDLASPRSVFLVITSGESGQTYSKHYDDQTSLWLNGGYVQVTSDWEEITHASWDHLELHTP